MDELTLMRSFRAERVTQNPTARAAARHALEAHFEAATAIPAVTATPPRRPRRLVFRRRRLLAATAAVAAATVIAGSIVVLDSGPTTQPAAAQILHETAAIAASPDDPVTSPLPAPGQFLYKKFKRLELKSWVPGGESMGGGRMTRPGVFTALMPTTQEWWTALDGSGRIREVAGTPQFLTDEELSRWEAAGSRLPAPFDLEYQRKYPLAFADSLELSREVVDRETSALERFRFPDTSRLPTDPAELRLAVEANEIEVDGFNLMDPSATHLGTEETIAQLFNILQEGSPMTPQLRAAVFNALAEVPTIEVNTDATDFLGRRGYSVRSVEQETGGSAEFIFDPDTAELLAQRSVLGDPGDSPFLKGIPAGQTMFETAYLGSAIVDSTDETVKAGE